MTDRAREIAHKYSECRRAGGSYAGFHTTLCDALTADIVAYVSDVREATRDDARERGAVYPEDVGND